MIAPSRATRESSGGKRPRGARGFTLLEAALATVIIAVGVLALIEAQSTMSRANDWSSASATATYLANELRERMRILPRHDPVTGLYIDASNGNALVGWGPETGELTVTDYDDLDDFDGVTFGAGGTFPGPIDAEGRVIEAIDSNGNLIAAAGGAASGLPGWSQSITVEKVDPLNFSTVRAHNYVRAAQGSTPALAVDQFPLRVTVSVRYQGPTDRSPQEMARVVWIAPP